MTRHELLQLCDIARAPAQPGIYAWYCRPSLTKRDIDDLISGVKECSTDHAIVLVREFLSKRLLRPFAESSYRCEIRGQLKPGYSGTLHSDLNISDDLVKRIAESPDRLWKLRHTLQSSVPTFASPIYIGMTSNLRQRLIQHKARIERYGQVDLTSPDPNDEDQVSAHSFARQVHERRFLTNWLLVAVQPIETDQDEQKDAENILNRINFPICGRN